MELTSLTAVSWWLMLPLIVLGSLLHFAYDWSGHHRVAAVFAAVNESYWEHVKIAVWPVVLAQFVLFALGGWRHLAFIPAAAVSLYSIPVTMIGLVFLYKSITRRNVLWLDIGAFAVTIVAAQVIFINLLERVGADATTVALAAIYLAGLVAAFLIFTLRPPKEPDMFIDPITQRYGVRGHGDAEAPLQH